MMDSSSTDYSPPDVVTIFEEALAEEGLDAEVTHYTQPTQMTDVIRVTKEVNGEPVHSEQHIHLEEIMDTMSPQQLLAHHAREAARQFDEYLTEQVEWGDRAVRFDMKDGHSAICLRCGAEVSLNDLERRSLRMSETAVPQSRTGSYESLPTEKIRMTLLALLKDECRPQCPNSPHNRKI